MVRSIAITLSLFGVGLRAYGQIDLTPKESFYETEGIRMPNVVFANGGKTITYSPPVAWSLSGGGRKLTLTPADRVQASGIIELRPVKESIPATEASLPAFCELAMEVLPAGASKVEVVDKAVSSLRISGKAMVEVTLSYVFFGQQYRTNILFLPRDKEQLRFQVTAKASDFSAVLRDFRGSLFSMQGL